MTIAFDIDGTWDRDPQLFIDVASMFRDEKWTVVIVTGREQPADKIGRLGLLDFPIVVSGPLLKEHAALKAGYKVDVWVDDMPGVIQDCKILQPSDDL